MPTDNCSAGYYCSAKAISATPTDGTTGDRCPAGYYCIAGSSYPTPCSPGTYSSSVGNTMETDCLNCSYGEYCGSYNLTETTGKAKIKKLFVSRTRLTVRKRCDSKYFYFIFSSFFWLPEIVTGSSDIVPEFTFRTGLHF